MTEALYRTVAWNEKQVEALIVAADGLAEIERRDDDEVVVKTTDFPTLFGRMVKILSETSAK